ncbi:MAG TPA: DUF4058 family protein [Gemmataceae bacterium]|nr:DUF4058 family protein [Gemmataceae bacterium]
MPLRDHFHPPTDNIASWEGLHGQWPGMIVLAVNTILPNRFCAAPCISTSTREALAYNEYQVRVYDAERGRKLVATIEIVSPAIKDRPEHRRAFVGKCEALLANQVSVMIVDLVTSRDFNLFAELLDFMGQAVPNLGAYPSPIYAVACRAAKPGRSWKVASWLKVLKIGEPLPELPLWLAEDLSIPLDLEQSYEATCEVLRIP